MLKQTLKHPVRAHYKHPSTTAGSISNKYKKGDELANSDIEDGHTSLKRR